jgi:TPM domain
MRPRLISAAFLVWFVIAAAWLTPGGTASSAASETLPPAPEALFNDYAHVVPAATAARLNRELEHYRWKTSNRIVVVVYPSVPSGVSIEDYTLRVARAWNLARETAGNSAVLFVFVAEHKMRLRVSDGLEDALPRAVARRLIDDRIAPPLERGDYAQALTAGVNAILATVGAKGGESGAIFELQLIWGTNDRMSPNPRHKPVEPDIRDKLKALPLKWSHYFEVNRRRFVVPLHGARTETVSKRCAMEVRNLGGARVEICLFGQGKKVVNRSQDLPRGELLVLGGNAPNATAWLVVLKRIR